MSKVKVSERMTDRTKTICPPIFDLGGIKIDQTPRSMSQGHVNMT